MSLFPSLLALLVNPMLTETSGSTSLADARPVPLVTFYRMIDSGMAPQPADRSAGGLIPTRAFRYCEAVTTASGLGWYVFPPLRFSLLWDGSMVHWSFDGEETWLPLDRAQFPDFAQRFDASVPDAMKGYSPPFLGALPEPGVVQVWSGLFARTRPDWSLLLRPAANMPRPGHYDLYEGVVEADRWFGPLFTNVRIMKTDVPVRFDPDYPLFQVQPIHRSAYLDREQRSFACVDGLDGLDERDWSDFARTVMKVGVEDSHRHGANAVEVRRRRKAEEAARPA